MIRESSVCVYIYLLLLLVTVIYVGRTVNTIVSAYQYVIHVDITRRVLFFIRLGDYNSALSRDSFFDVFTSSQIGFLFVLTFYTEHVTDI